MHSGRVIKGGGDKTVPVKRNDWNIGIFFYMLDEWYYLMWQTGMILNHSNRSLFVPEFIKKWEI